MPIMYSNSRMYAVIEDWPSGSKRTRAIFEVQCDPKRGERGTRITIDPKSGKPNAMKTLTYSRQVRIVDGDDGKTYFLELSLYGFISVMRGDMKCEQESIWPKDERFDGLLAMFQGSVAA